MPVYDLDPSVIADFATKRGSFQTTYGSNMAATNYQSFRTGQEYDANFAEQTKKWDQGAGQIGGSFRKRGLFGGGSMRRANRDYTQARQFEFTQLANQQKDKMFGYDQQRNTYNNQYYSGMQDLGNQEATARGKIAAQLRGETIPTF